MKWMIAYLGLLIFTAPALGAEANTGPTVIVAVGAEGESSYGRAFALAAERWGEAVRRGGGTLVQVGRGAPPAAGAATLPATSPETNPGDASEKQSLRALLEAESKADAGAARPLWLVLIGHGTHDGQEAKFNLRGPDVSDRELAEWLRDCRRPLAVVNCSSASAPFLNRLSGPGRVIVTATQSGQEIHFSRFGEHLSAAIADAGADLDKDGQTSLLEAFLAASHRVEAFYKQEGRLATEHALLDDNGDALGTPATFFQGTRAAKGGAALDGTRAHQWHLIPSAQERAMPADAKRRRDELEAAVEALRAKRATLAEDAYLAGLEPLLLELARVYEAAEKSPEPTSRPARDG